MTVYNIYFYYTAIYETYSGMHMNPAPSTMAAEVRHYGVAIRSGDVLLAAAH